MSIRTIIRGFVAASIISLVAQTASAAIFVQPTSTELSGTSPSGLQWTAVATGTTVSAGPGDEVAGTDGEVMLAVRVQCPNWLEVDRVQVFVNGRAVPEANFTRRDGAGLFTNGVVKVSHEFPLRLVHDSHLIGATIGEGSSLGVVVGPDHGQARPVAVANPIFVDVDGDGFAANGDLLGLPIPHQEKPTQRRHVHRHAHPHGHDND